jgi:hypothetical protein
MRMLFRFFFPIVILTTIGISGCCDCGKTTATSYPPTTISISEGGGVTGQFVGYTIDAGGTVHTWRGFAASKRDSTAVGTLDAAAYRDLLHTAYASHFSELRQYETGNMTATLEVTSGELLYRFVWPGLWRESASTPAQLKPLIKKIESIVDSINANRATDSDIP